MQLTTFGFEFEVVNEAAALTRFLYDEGHLPHRSMHSWHCNCAECVMDSGFLFRAQTDSSCSGEIITSVLHHDPADERYRPDVFAILQNAALAVDAEPGFDAGMHVHVGVRQLSSRQQDDAFWAFLRYEPLLVKLAAGRFQQQRGNNQVVREQCADAISAQTEYPANFRYNADRIAWIDEQDEHYKKVAREDIRYRHMDHDRHSNLNLCTNHNTWEYRLWNSTRSAWRMELYTRLSVALVDPAVNRLMNDAPPLSRRLTDEAIENFAGLLERAGHDRAAELVLRQHIYATTEAATAPSTLTSF